MFKKTAIGGALLAATLAGLMPAAASAQVTIIRMAPPAPVVETVPAPRPGYVWAAGHHEWRGNQYVWVPGQWYVDRPDYEYRTARWVERNGQWQMVGGDWVRRGPYGDRDHDGIPNRYDNHNARNRFGPYGDLDRDGIANRHDRDRDGDGVANRRDRFPDDRRRS